ncbi:MAG: hypothetical protein KTR27_09635 [Leptolyngbyaceae cyanobacterium MAG.088]|nr:hypothetical protein [Leptolyngbyaceae cyanobacterium MAG.088]
MEFDEKEVVGLFSTKVKANLNTPDLKGLLTFVLYHADEMEQTLMEKDVF